MKNYKNEEIPSINDLNTDIKINLSSIQKLKFNDYYLINNRNEFQKNDENILKYFKFNSKLHKNDTQLNEIKGLYILFDENEKPVYIGISKTVIRRLKQHFNGKNHNESTLAYVIATKKSYPDKYGVEYDGEREKFPYDEFREEIQKKMIEKWKISLIPENDNYRLYYKEIYYASLYKTGTYQSLPKTVGNFFSPPKSNKPLKRDFPLFHAAIESKPLQEELYSTSLHANLYFSCPSHSHAFQPQDDFSGSC